MNSTGRIAKRLGVAGFIFFTAKGMAWIALAILGANAFH